MKISLRLEKILSLITGTDTLLDIGTDHGYIPIAAICRDLAIIAVASDISDKAIKKASKNVAAAGLEKNIKIVKSDGFKNVPPYYYDTVVISGMGGELIKNILSKNKGIGFRFLILSPQSEPEVLRHYLIDKLRAGIASESYVSEDGVYYLIIKADMLLKPETYSEDDYMYGKNIEKESIPTYISYLKYRLNKLLAQKERILEGRYGIKA